MATRHTMPEPTSAELKYLVARQSQDIKTLNDVGRLLRSTIDPQQTIRLVASYLNQAFPLALCGVLLTDERMLQLIRFAPISQVDMAAAIQQFIATAAQKDPQAPRQAEIQTILEDQFASSGPGTLAPMGALRSHLVMPLASNSKVVGLLGLFSGSVNAFGQEDVRAIGIVADQLQAALDNALLVEKLRLADHLKNDLLAMLSHELRIPLTVIREGVELLREKALGPLTQEQDDFLNTVHHNVERLRQLLEKVLVATQVIAGTVPYIFEEVNLQQLVSELEATFAPLARTKGLGWELKKSPNLSIWGADRGKLKQVLGYLLENAIQATPSGGKIALSASIDGNTFQIDIADTGAGVPPEELPRLFDSFRAVGGIHERKTGGLGLGLFLTKAFIDGHGGTIQVESRVNHGTQFRIRLPAKK